jgi:hypothetical protein
MEQGLERTRTCLVVADIGEQLIEDGHLVLAAAEVLEELAGRTTSFFFYVAGALLFVYPQGLQLIELIHLAFRLELHNAPQHLDALLERVLRIAEISIQLVQECYLLHSEVFSALTCYLRLKVAYLVLLHRDGDVAEDFEHLVS